MKRIIALSLFLCLSLLAFSCKNNSSNPVTPTKPNLTGHWIGSGNFTYLLVTATVSLDLNITGTDDPTGVYDQILTGSGTLMVSAAGSTLANETIPVIAGSFKNPDVNLTFPPFTGKLSTDQKSIVGNATYLTYTVPITLVKQ